MVLDLAGVTYRYGTTTAVDEVTLRAGRGEVVALVGPNGAGKTTLLRLAMGLLTPGEGSVRLFGNDPRRREHETAIKQRVGYVPEASLLPPRLQVAQVLALYRSLYPTWDRDLEHDLLRRRALAPTRRIRDLSKGERRWVALVCALAHRPELLILDEPAGGLDPAARREFLEAAIARLADDGTTVVFSSHYMAEVERVTSRVAMMLAGRLVLDRQLTDLTEEICLVVLSPQPTPDLRARPDCLGVRRVPGAVHVLFDGPAAAAARVFGETVQIRALGLEDLFVELVGEQ